MTITKTVLGAVVLALLVTLPAQAQLPQTLDEMKAHLDAVASHLALDMDMSETELTVFWPQKFEKLGDLPHLGRCPRKAVNQQGCPFVTGPMKGSVFRGLKGAKLWLHSHRLCPFATRLSVNNALIGETPKPRRTVGRG